MRCLERCPGKWAAREDPLPSNNVTWYPGRWGTNIVDGEYGISARGTVTVDNRPGKQGGGADVVRFRCQSGAQVDGDVGETS